MRCVSDPDIRFSVLYCLDERFDPHLAQSENLSSLFHALYDEAFEIRERAICMIGRLSSKNPAYVMPSLRQILLQVRLACCPVSATGGWCVCVCVQGGCECVGGVYRVWVYTGCVCVYTQGVWVRGVYRVCGCV